MSFARTWCGELHMTDRPLLHELGEQIVAAMRNSPAQDIEKNLRALLPAFLDHLDLVAREDFEIQRKLLERAQSRLSALEARLAELEARATDSRRR